MRPMNDAESAGSPPSPEPEGQPAAAASAASVGAELNAEPSAELGGATWEGGAEAPLGGATWEEAPGLVARGACMGMADVIPGVSGGTMALILGIYARLIDAIRSFDLGALALLGKGEPRAALARVHWRFLGAVVCGQGLGVVVCTKGIKLPALIQSHPEPVYALFFGLVLGSTLWLLRDLVRSAGASLRLLLPLAGGLGLGLLVVTAVPSSGTPETPWFVFLCGSVSICAMVLPGISGSFVLLLLHQYEHVLGAVGDFIHPEGGGGRLQPLVQVVLPFAAGCLLGLLTFVRVLGWLLRKAEQGTMAFMSGLLMGSLYALWPFAERTYQVVRGKTKPLSTTPVAPDFSQSSTWIALGLVLVGVGGVVLLERLGSSKKR